MSQVPSNAGGLIGQRLGKYELVALLALGGTAEIYLARIGGVAGFEKYVVVKCLHDHLADDSDFVRMFLDEARLGAQLTHSNIVQTLELGEQQGRYYMVMEYLAGMSLAVIARKAAERLPGGRLPVDLVLGLMAQSCSGLHYAHNRTDSSGQPLNVVHRDVSPQNLVVTFEGILKVVDFGIAKAAMRETQTQSGTIKGKFAYMSPEQCMGNSIDHRTDVFALGVVVHELLTGRRLFRRDSAYDTYHAILQGKVPPPSELNHELDPALDEIVLKALAYEVGDRYQSAEELGEALSGVLHSRGKSVGATNVAQFFEEHFSNEITEHGQRMRALISGRQTTTMDEYWDDLDDSDVSSASEVSQSQAGPGAPASAEPSAARPAEPSQILTLDSALLEEDEEEDDEDGGGATRIELNPLERVKKLHRETSEQEKLPERDADKSDNKRTKNYQAMRGASPAADGSAQRSSAPPSRDAGPGSSALAPTMRPTPLGAGDRDRERGPDNSDNAGNVEPLVAGRSPQGNQAPGSDQHAPVQQPGHAPGSDQHPPVQQPGHAPGSDQHPPVQQPGGQWQPGPAPGAPGPGYGMPHPMPEHARYPAHNMQGGLLGKIPGQARDRPKWLLAVIFLICVGVGLGVTLLIADSL